MGARERGEGRPSASWGDSSVGGWHVTAVTVLGGGEVQAGRRLAAPPDPIMPHSPPVRPSSLTPATLRTVLISCQEDQLPSHTTQPRRSPPRPPPTYSPANQLAIHSSANQPLKFRLWHSGKEKGQRGRVLNTPTGGEADLITSWEWLWGSSCPDLSSGIHLRLP